MAIQVGGGVSRCGEMALQVGGVSPGVVRWPYR